MTSRLLISMAKVKLLLKKQGLRVSRECYQVISAEVTNYLLKAAERAKSNKRLTVLVNDL